MSQRTPQLPIYRPTAERTRETSPTAAQEAPDEELLRRAVLDLVGVPPLTAQGLESLWSHTEIELRDAATRYVTRPGEIVPPQRFASGARLSVAIAPRFVRAAEEARRLAGEGECRAAREREGIDSVDASPIVRRRAGITFAAGERIEIDVDDLPDEVITARQALGERVVSVSGASAIVDDDALAVRSKNGRRLARRPTAIVDDVSQLEEYVAKLESELRARDLATTEPDEVPELTRQIEDRRSARYVLERQRTAIAAKVAKHTPRRGRRGPPPRIAVYRARLVDVLVRLSARTWRPIDLARLIMSAPSWDPPPFGDAYLNGSDEEIARDVSRLLRGAARAEKMSSDHANPA